MTDGERAFTAYNESSGGVAYDGTPIPAWLNLRPEIRMHWNKAAEELLTHNRDMRSRAEIEERVASFVYLLASTKKIEDSTVWLHLRARELLWVLNPECNMDDLDAVLSEIVEDRKSNLEKG